MKSAQPLTLTMIVREPSDNDILMGRGGRNNRHPGNQKLRMLTKHFAVEYNACPRMEKPSIHNKIIDQVRLLRPPGRFLEYSKPVNAWIIVDDGRAREKVSQHLRDAVKNSSFSSSSCTSTSSSATKTTTILIQGRRDPPQTQLVQTQQLVVDPNMTIASYQMHQLQLLATTAQLNGNKSLQQTRSHQQNPLNFVANVNPPQTAQLNGNKSLQQTRSHQQNPLNFVAHVVNPQTAAQLNGNKSLQKTRSHQQNPLNFVAHVVNPPQTAQLNGNKSLQQTRSHQQNPLNFVTASNPPHNFAQTNKPPLNFVTANPQTRIRNFVKETQRSHQQNPLNFVTANPPLTFTTAINPPLNFVTVNPQTRIGNIDEKSQRSHKQDPPPDLESSNPTQRIPTYSKESQRYNKPNNPPPTRTVTCDKEESYKQRNPLDFDNTSSKKIPTYDEDEISATYHLAALPLLSLREGTYRNNERRGLEPNGINQGRRGLEPQGIDP